MTLYQELKAAGCEIDNHESDLYFRATKEAEAIMRKHPCNARRFVSQIDGALWWEAPFMFDPFWEAKAR